MNLKWLEEEAQERGWEKGRIKGIEEGIKEGIKKGQINTFLLLYQDGTLDKETCAKKLNLTIKEFEQLLKNQIK